MRTSSNLLPAAVSAFCADPFSSTGHILHPHGNGCEGALALFIVFAYSKGMPGYLTIELIRNELQDRTPEDNSIENDLFWTDEDIKHAMERVASVYNGMVPMGVDPVSPTALPADTDCFMDGVLYNLYKQGVHKLSRNVMQWQTGNTTVDLIRTRMEAFRAAMQMLANWKQEAKERKIFINRNAAWRYMR